MRVLFCVASQSGHLHPVVPIGRALVDRGHEVAVATGPSLCAAVEHIGFRPLLLPAFDEHPTEHQAFVHRISQDPNQVAKLLTGRLCDRALRALPELVNHIQTWLPDVLVRETLAWTAWLAGEKLDIPTAMFDFAPQVIGILMQAGGDELMASRVASGLEPDPELVTLSPWLTVVGAPPGWFPDAVLGANTHLFQPPDFDASGSESLPTWIDDLPTRPTVYATLGTAFNAGGLFPMIFEALGREDINVIATLGRDADLSLVSGLPDNVWVERYIPQSLVLPYCDAVVAHGGYGSLMGAIRRGIPLVMLPMAALDNRPNAERVSALGAGITITTEARSTDSIRHAVRAVLTDPSYRQRADAVARSVTTLRPLEDAALLIEQLAATGRPIPAATPKTR